MIIFSLVRPEDEPSAYDWHCRFAEQHRSIYPRNETDFHRFVQSGMAWAAFNEDEGDYVGLAYASIEKAAWEIGGLSVTIEARRNGVGLVLANLVLGHLLYEEDPLLPEPPGPFRVIVHVLTPNQDPRTIVQRILRFTCRGPVSFPADDLPGLPSENGYVHGEEFEISVPDTLEVLAEWAENWTNTLRNGDRTRVELREGITLSHWAMAFRDIAVRPSPGGTGSSQGTQRDPDDWGGEWGGRRS